MTYGFSFPTILVTVNLVTESGGRSALVRRLRTQGYLVLQAQGEGEALEIARVHSRPIQLLLTEEGLNGRSLAAKIKMYRPGMSVLFLGQSHDHGDPDPLEPEVARIRAILRPPQVMHAGGA